MTPLYYNVNNKAPMIIPDTQAHLVRHEIITFNYSIYSDKKD